MIEVENIFKSFGKIAALRGVSFTAEDGHVTGVLGPNGAGKTTLLRILYTILLPDSGTARVNGIDVVSRTKEVSPLIGALPHAHGLYDRLTTREHIRYYGRLHGMSGAALEDRINSILELLEMSDIADRRTVGFSQGQSVKVAVARSIVHDPPNILLDEPTTGLDVMSTRNMRAFIRRLRDQGRCILFSSHIMQEVSELCDHIVIIADGRIAASGSPEEIKRETGCEDLEDAFISSIGTDEGLNR